MPPAREADEAHETRDAWPGAAPAGPGTSRAVDVVGEAALAMGLLDPGVRDLLDPRALVWLPDSFPSFRPSAEYVRLRTVLGNRLGLRAVAPVGTSDAAGACGAEPPILPEVRCGAALADGKRCGRAIPRSADRKNGGYVYASARRCELEDHAVHVDAGTLADAVLGVVGAAYAPVAMAGAVRNAKGRADASQARLRQLAAEVARLDVHYLRLANLEEAALERAGWLRPPSGLPGGGAASGAAGGAAVTDGPGARAGGARIARSPEVEQPDAERPDAETCAAERREADLQDAERDVAFYRERRLNVQRRRDALRAERVALTAALGDVGRAPALDARLAEVAALAGHVGVLLPAARGVPGVGRPLLAALVAGVTVASPAPNLLVLEVALPNGGVRRRLAVTGPIRSTQPGRVWAALRLAAGDPAPAVEARLVAAGAGRGFCHGDGRQAHLFALAHRYFEDQFPAPPPRAGYRPVEAIAAAVGADADVVLDRALAGALGPGRVEAGRLALAPTAAELETAFPAYARHEVAARSGWQPGDAVLFTTAAARLGMTVEALYAAHDWSGRWSGGGGVARDAAGRRYLCWSALPGRLAALARDAAPDHATAYARARAAAVAAAGYAPVAAADWHPVEALNAHLRRRGTLATRRALGDAIQAGRVARIGYAGPPVAAGERTPRSLAYCPAAVYEGDDPAAVRAWLRGEVPAPPRKDAPDSVPSAAEALPPESAARGRPRGPARARPGGT